MVYNVFHSITFNQLLKQSEQNIAISSCSIATSMIVLLKYNCYYKNILFEIKIDINDINGFIFKHGVVAYSEFNTFYHK